MTPAARAHAKWFSGRASIEPTPLLDSYRGRTVNAGSPNTALPLEPADRFLTRRVCAADAAFVGTVVNAESGPTEDGSFLFTDYVFRIERVLRAKPGVRAAENEQVVVGRFGGEMLVDKARTTASHNLYPPLQIGGRYLVFVTYLSDSSSFVVDSEEDVLRVSDNRVTDLGLLWVRGLGEPGLEADLAERLVRTASCKSTDRGR